MSIEALINSTSEVAKGIENKSEIGFRSFDTRKTSDVASNNAEIKRATNKDSKQIDVDKRIPRDINAYEEMADNAPNKESELSVVQKKKLVNAGVSPGMLDKIRPLEDGTYEMKTSNNGLEGKSHAETNVQFVRKTIDVTGIKIEGVFPKFESIFNAQLPQDKLRAPDSIQFEECNKQLKEEVARNPELREKFSPRQLQQIEDGKTPSGYTWHHNEETGKLQLVDTNTHFKTSHTGGRALWGGGKDAR